MHVLKADARRSAVLVTNDTGPRHLAAAVGTPVVTLFGPTTPAWTDIGYAHERMIVAVDAGHAGSIGQITVEEVFKATSVFLREVVTEEAVSNAGAGVVLPGAGAGVGAA